MEQLPENVESTTVLQRLRKLGGSILDDVLRQLSLADLSPHEGRLRSSVAPKEYLPQVPDLPPSQE